MFGQLIESEVTHPQTQKPFTFAFSVMFHGVLVLLLLVVPICYPETLPGRPSSAAPPLPIEAPASQVIQVVGRSAAVSSRVAKPVEFMAPRAIPKFIDPIVESEPIVEVRGDSSGRAHGDVTGLGSLQGIPFRVPVPTQQTFVPEPPSLGPPVERSRTRIIQGGDVQQAKLIQQVKPLYPQLARSARVQDTVVLEAIISRDGNVERLRVLSGHPWLIPAALEAVQQWRYRPTLLNGEPVEVLTQVTVNFTLGS
jgi:periplasmic protein TonB